MGDTVNVSASARRCSHNQTFTARSKPDLITLQNKDFQATASMQSSMLQTEEFKKPQFLHKAEFKYLLGFKMFLLVSPGIVQISEPDPPSMENHIFCADSA